jgi:excisionase family DNA binding protein
VTGADSPSQGAHGIEALLSLDDVAQVLRISESGVYRLIRSGDLPRVKVGNRTLFAPHDVRAFIASRREATGENTRGPTSATQNLEIVDGQ